MDVPPDSSLGLDPEEMRRLGYRTVDMLVDRITGPPGRVVTSDDPASLLGRMSGPPPEGPESYEEILASLERDVLPYVARISHPGYLAFIPGEGTWPGALGDLVASALNLDSCWWLGASGPATLELVVLDWMRSWIGYPEGAAGVLVSGGSAANLTAMACARESLLGSMTGDAVAYMSDQSHVSLAKGARALGFRPDRVRVLASDAHGRMRPQALGAAISADRAAGLRPLVCVANAGSTAVGAIDPFAELAAICREQGVWLHVDGAYGAFACITERGRRALAGIELADSITLDPHKWLYQPVEVGALLVREGSQLRRAFEVSHDYLHEIEADAREVNFSDLGLQLTRTCRALKLWMSIRYFGLGAFRAAIDRCLDLAEHAQHRIESSPRLELVTPASLGIVTFRRLLDGVDDAGALDDVASEVAAQVTESGDIFVSTGEVAGRRVIRLCILNHSTTQTVIDRAVDLCESAELRIDGSSRVRTPEREQPVGAGWLARPQLDAGTLRSLPLFASLDDAQAARVLTRMREQTAAAGETVVGQFQPGRDLYVVLEGSVRVDADGSEVAVLVPGEFFGEMAVIDWGGGFGRSRSATVTAREPARLGVLDWDLATWLIDEAPEVSRQLREAARNRTIARAAVPPV
jgi:glutamate/tyrosine decarboxylase-like PLP-dependent enzyme